MSRHLQKAIENLMKRLVAMSARVEDNVEKALKALEQRDEKMARKVIEIDEEIDIEEIEIEEECLKILALYQPVAIDLRYIIAALKINNDLERIGDLAMAMAKHVIRILGEPVLPHRFDLEILFQKVSSMLKKSLDSIVNLNPELAVEVLKADDEVDRLNKDFEKLVLKKIKDDPEGIFALVQYIYISRRLERVADHATNIAEDVIYLVKGEIVRHGEDI
jgi:phosphate transport system protein